MERRRHASEAPGLRAMKSQENLDDLRSHAADSARACGDCGAEINTTRRKLCPACRLKRGRV